MQPLSKDEGKAAFERSPDTLIIMSFLLKKIRPSFQGEGNFRYHGAATACAPGVASTADLNLAAGHTLAFHRCFLSQWLLLTLLCEALERQLAWTGHSPPRAPASCFLTGLSSTGLVRTKGPGVGPFICFGIQGKWTEAWPTGDEH